MHLHIVSKFFPHLIEHRYLLKLSNHRFADAYYYDINTSHLEKNKCYLAVELKKNGIDSVYANLWQKKTKSNIVHLFAHVSVGILGIFEFLNLCTINKSYECVSADIPCYLDGAQLEGHQALQEQQ